MKRTVAVITVLIALFTAKLQAGEIHDASAAGDLNKVRVLIEADPTLLESKNDLGFTPLHSACYAKQVAVANYLIDKGANVNARDYFQMTPLHRASYVPGQDLALLQRLIDKGSEINAQATNGLTPLHWAAHSGDLKVAKLLIDHGADVNAEYSRARDSSSISGTVLQVAINYGPNEEMAKWLVGNGAKLNSKDSNGNTELHLAALKGYADLTQLLVKHGADVNAVNKYNHTALYYAAIHGYRRAADALIAAGAKESSIIATNYGKAPQLTATLKEGEAYLWKISYLGYAVKTKGHLILFNPKSIDESLEAGLANGHLNPNELAGQKITVFITNPERWPIGPEVFELAKQIQGVDFVVSHKPIASSAGTPDIPSYRLAVPNESFSVGGIQVHTIPALAGGMGYLVEADGVKVFHAGLHVSDDNASNVTKFRKEIDFLKPFGPIDVAILSVHSHSNDIGIAYEPYLDLLDQLLPKSVYLLGANIPEEYTKCIEVLRARNIPITYPEGGIAEGERFHYLRDRAVVAFDYLGQTPPGDEPQVFAKGSVSVDGKNTHALQFAPDGSFLVFSRYPDATSFRMARSETGWSQPEQTSFKGKEVSFDPLLKRLFYYDQGDLYFVRYGSAGFSEPTRLPPAINTQETEYYPSITAHRNLYFSRDGKWQSARVQVSKLQGDGFSDPVDLGEPINVGGASHAFVAPDESYMLFNSPRAGSYTKNDIWVSFRNQDGSWAKPVNLGPRINRDAMAVLCPTVSPDGKYLFFTRLQEGGTGFLYWVSTRVIEELRRQQANASSLDYSLRFATFFGQHDTNSGIDVVTDREGSIYVAGTTRDPSFPTTPGAYQTKLKGDADAFVAKFSPEGRLIYSTLIGGSKREHHVGLTVDAQGAVYLVGGTHPADFPTTPGAYDVTFNGEKDWGGDVYVLKLDPTGSKILFSTFVGGSAQETASAIQVDKHGNTVITGTTLSPDFPTTPGAFDRTFRGHNAFVLKLSSDGRRLLFSSLFGGTGFAATGALALDDDGNIYFAGFTNCPDLPVTANAIRKQYGGGQGEWEGDGFLAKFDPEGKKLLYSTYLGGKGDDSVSSVTVDRYRRIYVTGSTSSPDFPVTERAFRSALQGKRNAFISIFDTADMKLVYSTLFGGSLNDFATSISALDENRVVVGGATDSPDFPITENTQDAKLGSAKRLFFSVLDWRAGRTLYSSTFGGGAESTMKMHADSSGNLALIGVADSAIFSATPDAYRTEGSGPETFVVSRFVLRNPETQIEKENK